MRNVTSDIRPAAATLVLPDPLPDLVAEGFAALSEAGALLSAARALEATPRLARLGDAIIRQSAFLGHRLMIERAGLDGVIDQAMIAAERRRASQAGLHGDGEDLDGIAVSQDAEIAAMERRLEWLVGRLAALEARLARLTNPAPPPVAPIAPVVHAQRARLAAAFGPRAAF